MTIDNVIRLFQQHHYYMTSGQLTKHGVHTSTIRKMIEMGVVERVKRGLYRLSADTIPEYNMFTVDYFDAAIAVPAGVFCLTTALYFHGLTTRNPIIFDLSIPRTHRTPKLFTVSVRFYRFQEPYYSYGIEKIQTPITTLKIYDKEKSICDAFRLRNSVGEDIAMESIHTYLKKSFKDIHKLLKTAEFCKVKHIVEPIVKAMVGI